MPEYSRRARPRSWSRGNDPPEVKRSRSWGQQGEHEVEAVGGALCMPACQRTGNVLWGPDEVMIAFVAREDREEILQRYLLFASLDLLSGRAKIGLGCAMVGMPDWATVASAPSPVKSTVPSRVGPVKYSWRKSRTC